MPSQPCVLIVFGTRPECIKLAPLILELQKQRLKVLTCFTGQHREMALPILEFFKIKIDYNLEIMRPGQTLNDISLALLTQLVPILKSQKIDYIAVQGDTTTAAIAALVGFQNGTEVLHIEAGLRTNNLKSPWPEEFNRRMVALTAKWHFAPTEKAVDNLLREGYPRETIFNVGNTGIDALRLVVAQMGKQSARFKEGHEFLIGITLHRRENFGDEMKNIMTGLKILSEKYPEIKFIWPMHQNPNVKKAFDEVFAQTPGNMRIESPLNYFDFICLMSESDMLITDSGGVQEEAPFLGKPILVCRTTTERPESVDCGSAKLIGTSTEALVDGVTKLYTDKKEYQRMAEPKTPYGNGHASAKIVQIISSNSN